MELDTLAAAVARWAAREPLVLKAYLYGSRVRGTESSTSDLDIAIELRQRPGDATALATWIGEAWSLQHSVALFVPVRVQLEWYGGPEETPIIDKALSHGSIQVYPGDFSSRGDVVSVRRIPDG